MADAFFVADGDRFLPTDWARGPWDPRFQHGGPPAALIGRAFELYEPIGMHLARFTLEILRPIPVAPLRLETELVRPGKRVQYLEATLSSDEGEAARASAWRIRVEDDAAPAVALDAVPYPPPEEVEPMDTPQLWGGDSYFTGMEWRFARGKFFEPGPAVAWMRQRVPLLDGEEPTPVQRLLAVADSGNGISLSVRMDRYLFINTELSVHLLRPPSGEWVCLDAQTRIDPRGVGLAESVLWDQTGRIGSGRQMLYVGARDDVPTGGPPRAGES